MKKRDFLKNMSMLSVGLPLSLANFDNLLADYEGFPADRLAADEDFWLKVRGGYRLKDDYINLENGYYCFVPQETLEGYIDHIREINYQGSWYMRTVQWENKKKSAAALAELAGCSPEELVITRNTTESLDLVIAGIHWEEGDEAVMA
jgi:selenocysteine lyase/cysteine desulfurase